MNTNKLRGSLLIGAVLLLCFKAWGEEVTLPVTAYSVISSDSENRLLVNIPIPDNAADSNLLFAEFSIRIIPELTGDSILTINCHAVSTTWEPDNVGWEFPWQNPGGDFEADEGTFYSTVSPSDSAANFDITELLRAWLIGDRANYGLIFIVPERSVSDYQIDSPPDLPGGAIGTVRLVIR